MLPHMSELCATHCVMAVSRYGKTRTLSISVDATTDRILKEEAKAHFGGNVSKLVSAIALEARRAAAVNRIVEWSGYTQLSNVERDEIETKIQKELAAQKPKKKRRPVA
jgi:hypothetical protein